MKDDQILINAYFSGVYDTLNAITESIKESLYEAEEMGIGNPKIEYEELLETFNKLKDLANERQNNRR